MESRKTHWRFVVKTPYVEDLKGVDADKEGETEGKEVEDKEEYTVGKVGKGSLEADIDGHCSTWLGDTRANVDLLRGACTPRC